MMIRLTRYEMVICPFASKEEIKIDARLFRINKRNNRLEFCVIGNERKRVMDEVSKALIRQIKEQGNTYFEEGDFVKIFGDWFRRLCKKRITSNSTSAAEIERSFMQEGKELVTKLVAMKNKPTPVEEPEAKAPDVIKSENIIIEFKLKTGVVKIEFENEPTQKDIDMLNQYLKYNFDKGDSV